MFTHTYRIRQASQSLHQEEDDDIDNHYDDDDDERMRRFIFVGIRTYTIVQTTWRRIKSKIKINKIKWLKKKKQNREFESA